MGRALVRSPKAFLMDEPLSNLDAALRVEMRGEIKRLHRQLGVTTVYVTHDQVEAMTMGDRVAVMRGGRLQQFDAPQKLYEQPANMFVASFIGSPAINLAMAQFDRSKSALAFAGQTIPLSKNRVPSGDINGPVMMGIRPEAFSYRQDPEHDVSMTVTQDLVESLGSELLVHFTVQAAPVPQELTSSVKSGPDEDERNGGAAGAQSVRFIAKLEARSAYQVGVPATIWFSTDHMMLFEPAAGQTVLGSVGLVTNAE